MNFGPLTHVRLLENVQRIATEFILNYPKDMSYKDRFLKLNLLPLEYRMDLKDLVLIFKAKAGQTEIRLRTRNTCKVFRVKTTTYLMQNKTI